MRRPTNPRANPPLAAAPGADRVDRYATHLAPLVGAALSTSGGILELGCGDYSTPVLAEIARHKGVPFVVMASDPVWADRFRGLCTVRLVDWAVLSASDIATGPWGCVLLDNEEKTAARIRRLPVLREIGRAIVVHDLENCERHGHWGEMISGFTSVDRFTDYQPGTAVLRC